MKFSIIVALYNKAQYIEETIASALAQSFTDFEIIVVDDGSKDDGADRVAAVADPRVRLIRQPNGGVSVARNHGIEHARGEWIAFLDADDMWRPNYLEVQAGNIDRHPAAGMVATGFHHTEDVAGWLARLADRTPLSPPELIDDLPTRWSRSPTFFTSSLAVNASLLKSADPWFPPGEIWGEDLDVWFRLAETTRIVFQPEALVGYRAASGGLSRRDAFEVLPPYLARMRARAQSPHFSPERKNSIRLYVAEQQLCFARASILIGRRGTALRWLRQSASTAVGNRRWWVTLALTFTPVGLVRHWQDWRSRTVAVRD